MLILVVLYLFLRDIRAALIAFTAIPLSLLAAIAVLDHIGLTLNTMTLGGFAVALGVLVDDAIIGIENIMRRLRENQRLAQPLPRLDGDPRGLPGGARTGDLCHRGRHRGVPAGDCSPPASRGISSGPLALAFIFAVLASLLVAMTTTPALCALLLRGRRSLD